MTKDVNESLPAVTADLCKKILDVCLACKNTKTDVFTTSLREFGVKGWEIAAIVRAFFADLAEDACLSIRDFTKRIETALPFLEAEQLAV
jgi:hypothetical protein